MSYPPIDPIIAANKRGQWCACSLRPLCEYHYCRKPANCSVRMPSWNKTALPGRFKFMCEPCLRYWYAAMGTPIKGLDRPPNAPDDWKPSLIEVVRHGEIALAFERRHERARPHHAAPHDGGKRRMLELFRAYREGRL